ncbi:MAG: SulP family inorganic anion transporter [Gemmatimonadales bacterium]|nr:SulP family inorganic anion transporter [Gemmatimonadales bacterium]MDZ4389317.1 SulP family inorganic anion transporter [Gemmatimonadales bacterium]
MTAATPSPQTPPPPVDQSTWLKDDLAASVVVFLVALPLSLGIALASGAPLFAGIIAGVVGGLVVAPLSGSALLVSGPAAGLTAIVIAAITDLGGFQPFLVAVVIAGTMQMGLGLLGAGVVSYYFPSSVIKGMLAAIGLILILKQLPYAVGYEADPIGDESFGRLGGEGNTFTTLLELPSQLQLGAVLIALIGIGMLLLWERPALKRLLFMPGPLVVVLLGVGLNELFRITGSPLLLGTEHLVQLPPTNELLGEFSFPTWVSLAEPQVWRVAVTLAIVASIETLLSMEATDKIDPYKRQSPPNKELMAQGAGNVISGMLGGLPITGVIVRSSANIDAGGKTKRSAIFHSILLGTAVLLIPTLLSRIPLASLAAILLYTGYKLASPRLFRVSYRLGWEQFVPFTVTILAILLTDLLVGIGIGLAFGAFYILREHAYAPALAKISPSTAILQRYVLGDQATFLAKASLSEFLQQVPANSRLEIDGRATRRIDYDIAELLIDFRQTATARNIDYRLIGVPDVKSTPAH